MRDLCGGRNSWSRLRTRRGEIGVTIKRRERRITPRRRSSDSFSSKGRRRSVNAFIVGVGGRRCNRIRVSNWFGFENQRRGLGSSVLFSSIRHRFNNLSIFWIQLNLCTKWFVLEKKKLAL